MILLAGLIYQKTMTKKNSRALKSSRKIQSDSEVLVVIGIGGSYLGAQRIEFLTHSFNNLLSKEERKAPQIFFCRNSISSTYLADLINVIGDRDFSVNVISKSGTTTEPRLLSASLKSY